MLVFVTAASTVGNFPYCVCVCVYHVSPNSDESAVFTDTFLILYGMWLSQA